MQVLDEYLKLHEFAGQEFLPALRFVIKILFSYIFLEPFFLAFSYLVKVKKLIKFFYASHITTSCKIPALFIIHVGFNDLLCKVVFLDNMFALFLTYNRRCICSGLRGYPPKYHIA